MLGEEFDARLARVPLSLGQSGVDPFGLDPEWTKNAIACTALLYRKYFRCEAYGTANVPTGRVLLIANHSGQIPVDAAMAGLSAAARSDTPRFVRASSQ